MIRIPPSSLPDLPDPIRSLWFVASGTSIVGLRAGFRAAALNSVGWYHVTPYANGEWIANNTMHGQIGRYLTRDLAARACSGDDAARAAPLETVSARRASDRSS